MPGIHNTLNSRNIKIFNFRIFETTKPWYLEIVKPWNSGFLNYPILESLRPRNHELWIPKISKHWLLTTLNSRCLEILNFRILVFLNSWILEFLKHWNVETLISWKSWNLDTRNLEFLNFQILGFLNSRILDIPKIFKFWRSRRAWKSVRFWTSWRPRSPFKYYYIEPLTINSESVTLIWKFSLHPLHQLTSLWPSVYLKPCMSPTLNLSVINVLS